MQTVQEQTDKLSVSYQEIHNLVKTGFQTLEETNFKPDYIIAIGGGGFIPARILRTYIDVPILALTISFYDGESHAVSKEPVVIQNIEPEVIRGKKVLIVDEVDDTRSTLNWIVTNVVAKYTDDYGIFVVHNKIKNKVVSVENLMNDPNYYISCLNMSNVWINYPWDDCFTDSPRPFIEELKSIRRTLFRKYAEENWDESDESEYDETHEFFGETTLFELLLYLSQKDKILTYKMLNGKEDREEVDFNEFQYDVYTDYLKIYRDWGYERIPQDINDYIMEDYLNRKNNPESWATLSRYNGNDCLPYFKLEFRIPQQQVQKYNERVAERRLQEEYEHSSSWMDN